MIIYVLPFRSMAQQQHSNLVADRPTATELLRIVVCVLLAAFAGIKKKAFSAAQIPQHFSYYEPMVQYQCHLPAASVSSSSDNNNTTTPAPGSASENLLDVLLGSGACKCASRAAHSVSMDCSLAAAGAHHHLLAGSKRARGKGKSILVLPRHLHALDVAGHPLQSLGALRQLVNTRTLVLRACNLTTILPGTFAKLHSLRSIDLAQNPLTWTWAGGGTGTGGLHSDAFSAANNITRLDMGGTKITTASATARLCECCLPIPVRCPIMAPLRPSPALPKLARLRQE